VAGNRYTMATLTKEHLKEFECPVCLEYFRQPIILCRNGHNVCGKCRTQLEKCPLCRSVFLETRNRTLETVTSNLKVACKNRTFGCNMRIMLVNITAHEAKCHWRPYKCPMPDCAFECLLTRLRRHLNNVHTACLHTESQNSITSLINFGRDSTSNWHKAILFSDEIFVHVCAVRDSSLYTCVLHVGLKENTAKFSYSIQIERRKATYAVPNYICDLKQIIRSGNCARFDYRFAQRCAGDKNILKIKVHLCLRA
jgi:E3 ubiquitin-protein ligase SIAH1